MSRGGVLIAGGGTAGHLLPGLAIAKALVAGGRRVDEIHFVGSARGLDTTLVPEAGFGLTALPGRGIQRSLSLQNVASAWGLARAFARALGLVRRRRPEVVVSLGGYAALPAALAAVVWRRPLVVAEQNAVPSATNRIVGRFARACAVPFEGTQLPRAVVTGNPVRDEVVAVDREHDRDAARRRHRVGDDRLVLAFGGSLGARRINHAVQALVASWGGSRLVVHHVIGDRDWPELGARVTDPSPQVDYRPVRYEQDIPGLMAAADVVVCRAGASTVSELAAIGVPAVLVPLPGAPGDHQTANARALVDADAAVLVPDGELDADRLAAELAALLDDPDRLASMADAARSVGRPDAAEAVARLVEHHAAR